MILVGHINLRRAFDFFYVQCSLAKTMVRNSGRRGIIMQAAIFTTLTPHAMSPTPEVTQTHIDNHDHMDTADTDTIVGTLRAAAACRWEPEGRRRESTTLESSGIASARSRPAAIPICLD